MKSPPTPENISHEKFKTQLMMYGTHVPPKLLELDKLRFEEVPELLEARRKDDDAFLEKSEVTALVEWKL